MTIRKVAIVGANGNLGPSVLQALLDVPTFNVTVITRRASKSKYSDSVRLAYVADDPTAEELQGALTGQDAVVCTFAGTNDELQIRYADAAAKVGVRRFIPADFGSCDSSSPRALELMPLYRAKTRVRHYLQELAKDASISWTSLVSGHFFDYGMKSGLFQFDIPNQKALIFDNGDDQWSASTLVQIGLATARILQKEEETKNKMLYIQSVNTSQNEVLKLLEAKTSKWQVDHTSSEDFIKKMQERLDANPKDHGATENLVSVVGVIEGNWQDKADFANDLLGLKTESVEEALNRVLEA